MIKDNTKIAETISNWITDQLSPEATLTDIEQMTREVLHQIGNEVVKQTIMKQTQPYPEPSVVCECGGEANYIRQRTVKLHTLLGKVEVKRSYYLCPSCRRGVCPLDEKLGLRPNQLSAEVSRLAAMVGVQQPFAKGCELFETLTQVSLSDQSMAKATLAVGQKVIEEETIWQAQSEDEAFLLERKRSERHPLRLYGSIDATKVHIRDDETHRWRDLKVGAWYEARGRPPTSADDQWRIKAENITYFADIAPAADFAPLLWSEGVKRNAQLAHELIFIADGATWIWNLVNEKYPQAIQILDWFHAAEHLMPMAEAVFPAPDERLAWVADMKQLMWEGHIEMLLDRIDDLRQHHSADVLRTTANYFEFHKERMRYAHFRQQGYQIGSGTIESAAKQIGLMRLKVAGAIWNEAHARKVAKARASFLSNRWQELPLAM